MAGTLYLREKADSSLRTIDSVENIGVATPFLIINFTNGSTVLEEASRFSEVQFTPYPKDDGESPEGESSNNAGA